MSDASALISQDPMLFDRIGRDYIFPILEKLDGKSHVSVDPVALPSFLRAVSRLKSDPLFTLATHQETEEHADFIRAHKNAILYLDMHNDTERGHAFAVQFPKAHIRSAVYHLMAAATVMTPFAPGRSLPSRHPSTKYFIMCPPRSGSYYLCDMLSASGAGKPTEHIRPAHCALARLPAFDIERFLTQMAAYGADQNIFGTKFIFTFFRQLLRRADDGLDSLSQAGLTLREMGFKGIRLRRHAKVQQAVSKFVADHTKEYRKVQNDSDPELPPYNFAAIRTCLNDLEAEERDIDRFFLAFGKHMDLRYEQLDENPAAAVRNALDYLELPAERLLLSAQTAKQRNRMTESYVERFTSDLKSMG